MSCGAGYGAGALWGGAMGLAMGWCYGVAGLWSGLLGGAMGQKHYGVGYGVVLWGTL